MEFRPQLLLKLFPSTIIRDLRLYVYASVGVCMSGCTSDGRTRADFRPSSSFTRDVIATLHVDQQHQKEDYIEETESPDQRHVLDSSIARSTCRSLALAPFSSGFSLVGTNLKFRFTMATGRSQLAETLAHFKPQPVRVPAEYGALRLRPAGCAHSIA
jgi:hypothetical protein